MSPSCLLLMSDDEPMLIQALARQVRRMGVEVVADSESKVVELARARPPAVIVLDSHQAVSGLELLARLKADPATREIPVIMVSGGQSEADQAQAGALGAIDWVLKPFEPTFIRWVVELCHQGLRVPQPAGP